MEDRSTESDMCFYWQLILNIQLEIVIFVRSIRESNFLLYIESLRAFIKYYFSLDHFHYARWLTVHLFDLTSPRITAPDVHKKFSESNFAFQKTLNEFSKMSLDQVHEQNNAYIKGVSVATHLVNRSDDAGSIRCELCVQ